MLYSQYINSAERSFTHVCNASQVKAISQTIINKEELANNLNRLVPIALRNYVNSWTDNKNMLLGIEIPDVSLNGSNNIIDLTKRIHYNATNEKEEARENLQILLHCRFLLKGVSMLI